MKRTLSNLLLIVVVLGMLVSCKAPAPTPTAVPPTKVPPTATPVPPTPVPPTPVPPNE